MYKIPWGADPAENIPVRNGPQSDINAWTKVNVQWFARKGAGVNRGDNTFSQLHGVHFSADFIYAFDMKKEQFTQYLLPDHDIRIRELKVDDTTTPSSVWAPDFTPPGKVIKIQAR